MHSMRVRNKTASGESPSPSPTVVISFELWLIAFWIRWLVVRLLCAMFGRSCCACWRLALGLFFELELECWCALDGG